MEQTNPPRPPDKRPHVHLYDPAETSGDEPWDNPPMAKRRGKKLPNFLRWHQAMQLLDWCTAEIARCTAAKKCAARTLDGARRDEIIIRIGLYLGLRLAEFSGLDVNDVDLNRRSVLVHGKGAKDRYVRISEKLAPHLEAWIAGRTSGVLIPGPKGRRMAGRTVHYRIVRAAKLAGLSVHVHPHLLRHTHATRLLETGTHIRTVQALLGHADLATTAVYLDLDVSRFAADVDRI